MKKLMICLKAVDSWVIYVEVSEKYAYCVDFGQLHINKLAVKNDYYPELKLDQLDMEFVFVDPEVI